MNDRAQPIAGQPPIHGRYPGRPGDHPDRTGRCKTDGRFLEAYLSARVLNHEISFGKQDDWLGPGLGGGMAYSNNAQNIYSFRINRVEPLHIPLLSRATGPFRYDFLVGPLRGHTYMPNPAYLANPSTSIPNVISAGILGYTLKKSASVPPRTLNLALSAP